MLPVCLHSLTPSLTHPLLTHSDELLVDCPDYHSLAPRPSIRSKKLHPKKQKSKVEKEEEEEEVEEITDEIRMCSPCEKLIDR